MKIDGIRLFEGGKLQNATIASGNEFPVTGTVGELFFRDDLQELFLYTNQGWQQIIDQEDIVPGGGNISYPISIDKGGTGKTTANEALDALLPSQQNNDSKVLITTGSSTMWDVVRLPSLIRKSVFYVDKDADRAPGGQGGYPGNIDGTINYPFFSINTALQQIEQFIGDGLIPTPSETAPIFIALLSSTTESVTLTRGFIYIVSGITSSNGFSPVINGTVTINAISSFAQNIFSLQGISIIAPSGSSAISFIGSNSQQLFLNQVRLVALNIGSRIIFANNTGFAPDTTLPYKIILSNCQAYHNFALTTPITTNSIDLTSTTVLVENSRLSSAGPVAFVRNGSELTVFDSWLETFGTTSCQTVQCEGATIGGKFFIYGSYLTNANATGASRGIRLNTATSQATAAQVTFNIRGSATTARTISGVTGSKYTHGANVFLNGSIAKNDNTITLAAHAVTMTAVAP